MTLPDLLQSITVARTAMARLIADLRKVAAQSDGIPEVRDRALALAATLEQAMNDTDFTRITGAALDELRDLVMTGRSIVQHSPTDIM